MLKRVPLWLRRAGFVLMTLVFTLLCLAKLPPSEPLLNDKLVHFIAFAMLAIGAQLSWPHQRFFPLIAAALIAYGATIEVVQFFLPWRSAEWLDLLADAAGVVVFGLLVSVLLRPKA